MCCSLYKHGNIENSLTVCRVLTSVLRVAFSLAVPLNASKSVVRVCEMCCTVCAHAARMHCHSSPLRSAAGYMQQQHEKLNVYVYVRLLLLLKSAGVQQCVCVHAARVPCSCACVCVRRSYAEVVIKGSCTADCNCMCSCFTTQQQPASPCAWRLHQSL